MRLATEADVADRLALLSGPEPRVVVSGNFAAPLELLRILDATLPRVRAFTLNIQGAWPRRDGFVTETPFVGPGVRGDPAMEYLPMRLSLVPRLFGTSRPPDAVLLHTSMPRDGKVSLGIEVNILPAAVEQVVARGGLVVAQLNPRMPFTGGDALARRRPGRPGPRGRRAAPLPRAPRTDDLCAAIGDRVAAYAVDGGTVQLGIGQIPDAAAAALCARRGLGVWSEMVSDGLLRPRSGRRARPRPAGERLVPLRITRALRVGRRQPAVGHAAHRGDQRPGPDRRPACRCCRSTPRCRSTCSTRPTPPTCGRRVYSGFGGQPDFVAGALHSAGGHAVVALRSWHDRSDTSTIVPRLVEPATSFQHSVIVTEHGSAEVFGEEQRRAGAAPHRPRRRPPRTGLAARVRRPGGRLTGTTRADALADSLQRGRRRLACPAWRATRTG